MNREGVALCAVLVLAAAGSWGCARGVSRGEFARLQGHVVNQTTMLESLMNQQGETAEQVSQVQQGSRYLESEIAYLKSQVAGVGDLSPVQPELSLHRRPSHTTSQTGTGCSALFIRSRKLAGSVPRPPGS